MTVLIKLSLILLLTLSTASCAFFKKKDSDFQWLDVDAVPKVESAEKKLPKGSRYRDLVSEHIELKQEGKATNKGLDSLKDAAKEIEAIK